MVNPLRSLASRVLAITLWLVLVPATPAAADPDDSASFYDTTGLAVGEPGSILRSEPIRPLGNFGTGERVIYSSIDANGTPVAVSGTMLRPHAAWTRGGARPAIVMGPGSQGQGDQCAPSRLMENGVEQSERGFRVNYDLLFINSFLAQGLDVFVTDYIGLGTPGVHTYINRLDQSHAMLDAARAAGGAQRQVAFWGHSQGGAASGGAAELAQQYAPELQVAGSFSSAPPGDLLSVVEHLDGTALAPVIGYALNGLMERYPQTRAEILPQLNDRGREMLATVAEQCILDSQRTFGREDSSTWTVDGRRLVNLFPDAPQAVALADQQRIGRLVPNAPVMVHASPVDDFIPFDQSAALVSDWCAAGATAVLSVDPLPPISPGNGPNHALPAVAGYPAGLQFVLDRFAGLPVPDACNAP
ncbi:lipase family protein [Millisia brevis]|uniref:lipase family protein n=1 Tax=Millisia brevis TaxID=264148 RepID=UPI00082CA108|nr:lipase family protein [Millisia brevis]